jgi:recombination protein RecA
MGQSHVGLQARLMSQALRKLTVAISRSRTIAIFINQLREKIGVMFGSPETTPGGRALKFYASVRLDVRRVGPIREGEKVIGSAVKVKVVKNKVAPPFRVGEFEIIFDRGVSWETSVLDAGLQENVIEKSGAWLNFGEVRLGNGREKARQYLLENPAQTEALHKAILKKVAESGAKNDGASAASEQKEEK